MDGYYYVPEIDYEEFDENYIYEVESNSVNQGVDSNYTEITTKASSIKKSEKIWFGKNFINNLNCLNDNFPY